MRLCRALPLLIPFAASAQQPAPVPQPPAAPPHCDDPRSRQFDFWIGEWNVTDRTTGKQAGVSHIERLYGGCVLRENWSSAWFRGGSLNIWSRDDGKWHQAWMDQAGAFRHFVGGIEGGKMVLVAEAADPAKAGATMRVRMTFTPEPDGTVRQYSDVSRDSGRTWTLRYDYLYRRLD
jgi:hypothetical protein